MANAIVRGLGRGVVRGLGLVERWSRGGRLRLQSAALRRRLGSDLSKPNDSEGWEVSYVGLPLEPVRATTSPVARVLAELTKPGEVLLEAGCGSGSLSAELAVAGRKIELADFSQPILDRAVKLFDVSGLPRPGTTLCDLTRPLPWADGAADVVWSSGVLEHWTDEELVPIVREMKRVARRAVISLVPSASCVFYRLGKHWAERQGTWPYGRELPRSSLRGVFESAGLRDVREWTVLADDAPLLLRLTDTMLARAVIDWWSSLPADDPVRAGQGYLLVTVGEV
jgi:SAM-dependent methyltransferase